MDVKIIGSVKHNGKHYEPGDEIKRMKEEDGERLIRLGVAIAQETKPSGASKEKVEKIEQITPPEK